MSAKPEITIDKESGAIYIKFNNTSIFYTKEVKNTKDQFEQVNIDYSYRDEIVGIEIT